MHPLIEKNHIDYAEYESTEVQTLGAIHIQL